MVTISTLFCYLTLPMKQAVLGWLSLAGLAVILAFCLLAWSFAVVSPQLCMRRTLLGSKFQNTLHQFPSPWSLDPSPSLANFPFLLPSTNWRKALHVYDSGQLFLVIVSFHLYSVVCGLGTQDLGQFFAGLLELSRLLLHKHCDFIFFLHFWLFLVSFFSFGYQSSFDT